MSSTGPAPRLRLAFLYLHPWDHEFRDVAAGRTPTHRLFGASELAAAGHRVVHCPPGGRMPWRLRQAGWALRASREVDALVATHEGAAQVCLLLRTLGLIRRPLLVMTVAATDDSRHGRLRRRIDAWLLRHADRVTVFARSQLPDARALGIAPERLTWLAFGVDTDFFRPRGGRPTQPRHVLSVGTNEGKDFATLMAALPVGWTAHVISDPGNLDLARAAAGDRSVTYAGDVPIGRLRELYAAAGVVAIPLRPSRLASGQTVLLEALAMDRRVVVSDVPGIRDYLAEGATRAVPPGDIDALRAALLEEEARCGTDRADDPDRPADPDTAAGPGGTTAREHVLRSGFTAAAFAARLEALLFDLVGSGG